MKKAFTLTELLITVAILGILAAVVLPTLKGHIAKAKESAAKDNLRILRNAIELYATQHDGVPPGYPNNDPSQDPTFIVFGFQTVYDGKYLSGFPKNPFNGKTDIKTIKNNEDFPSETFMIKIFGWIYKPATKEIRLNWPGTDSAGVAYLDY